MLHDSATDRIESQSSDYGATQALTPATPAQSASYIADLLVELRDMSGAAGHTFLAYLIQVAVEEARLQSR